MRKLRLRPEDLAVQSFAFTRSADDPEGTVHGQGAIVGEVGDGGIIANTGPGDTCPASCTCGDTCYIYKCPTYHTGSAAPCC